MFTWFGLKKSSKKQAVCSRGMFDLMKGLLNKVVFVSIHLFLFSHKCFFYFRDFNTEPELMPKTPSQRKKSRRKRISLGRQEESQASRFVSLINAQVNVIQSLSSLQLGNKCFYFLDYLKEGAVTFVVLL